MDVSILIHSIALLSLYRYCHDQIKALYSKALAIDKELGPTAADYYIQECIQKFQKGYIEGHPIFQGFQDTESKYLRDKLGQVRVSSHIPEPSLEISLLTPKVRRLIDYLLLEDMEKISGLIFVRTRAEVAVLSRILMLHVSKLAISTFVGASSFSGRKNSIGELVDVRNQRQTLDDLRQSQNHIVVTTNALEEGIDVAACNLVVCFELPSNLKSFIQRRGRARKSTSKFVLMFEEGQKPTAVSTWQDLEKEMRQIYQDHMRELQELKALEDQEEGRRELLNETTGYVTITKFRLIAFTKER